jgi:ribosomal protein L33
MMLPQNEIIYYKSQYGALVNYKTEKLEGNRYCPRVTRNPT